MALSVLSNDCVRDDVTVVGQEETLTQALICFQVFPFQTAPEELTEEWHRDLQVCGERPSQRNGGRMNTDEPI